MYIRATPAIEKLLSSRPLAAYTAPRSRTCLLLRLSTSRTQTVPLPTQPDQRRHISKAALSPNLGVDETHDGGTRQSLNSTPGHRLGRDFKSGQHDNGHKYPSHRFATEPSGKTGYEAHWRRAFTFHFHANAEQRAHSEGPLRRTEQRASALKFASGCSAAQIHEKWRGMSEELRLRLLPDILIGCLLIGAGLTLRVLEGLPVLKDDFWVRMDCLLKLRREPKLWSEIEADTRQELRKRFDQELHYQLYVGELPRYSISVSHTALILESCTAEQASQFLDRYLSTYSDKQSAILLIFVDEFTRMGDSDQALRALRHIPSAELEESGQKLLQRCTNLLRLDTIDLQAESKNFKILPRLLEMGIKSDTIFHNMIITNAIKHDVPRVGWDLYDYLQAESLPTDAVTHLLLMKDAFARQDVSGLNKMLSAIYKRKDLYLNPYLVGCTMNIVRIIYTWEKQAGPLETLSHLLSIHNRAWKPDIYVSLNMIRRPEAGVRTSSQLPPPPPVALAWTVFQFCLIQIHPSRVDRLWSSLQATIAARDPQILAAATNENLYGGFIVFYGRSPQTLVRAVDIVQYMLDSPHCPPTGRTWMRLMCAYLRHGQHREAEQIRRVMRKRGIQPRGKEFAYLLEHWPGTEVAERARKAMVNPVEDEERQRKREGNDDMSLDEELFEGVPVPFGVKGDTKSSFGDTATWEDMIDPWTQNMSDASAEDLETMKSLQATLAAVNGGQT